MNSLLDSDPYQDTHTGADREISLGTSTILGIFFALALVCAGFFGLGYTLGRRAAPAVPIPEPLSTTTPAASPSIIVKPSAGSSAAAPPAPLNETVSPPATTPPLTTRTAPTTASERTPPAVQLLTANPQPATPNAQPATAPNGAFLVQIAAVSTQDIADIEVTALKKYGFDVFVRHEPQDQLLHVQIGPYATRKDAVAMQQIILARGFNAIVK